jgi:ribonuclease HI
MGKNVIDVFTDGSFKNTKQGKECGYSIFFPNNEYKHISRSFNYEPLTNNRAELYAILKAIILCNMIKKQRLENDEGDVTQLNIYSDSEYSVKTLNKWHKSWIKKGKDDYLNKDIIDLIVETRNQVDFKVKLSHVRAHTGKKDYKSSSNNKADELAKKGAKRNNTRNKKYYKGAKKK